MIRSTLLLWLSFAVSQAALVRAACNSTVLNNTVGSWPVATSDTIFSIAKSTNRGLCDIARANRMSDATLMVAGETLIIPAEVCDQDNLTCLIPNTTYYRSCISGGLHTYNSRYNDTRATIANKFQVSLDAISINGNASWPADEPISADAQLKIPQCSPSQCTVQPYKFTYGTYVDLAQVFNTTVGQIMAFNPTYNYSHEADPNEGPVISMPMNCVNLTSNATVIS